VHIHPGGSIDLLSCTDFHVQTVRLRYDSSRGTTGEDAAAFSVNRITDGLGLTVACQAEKGAVPSFTALPPATFTPFTSN
jgi:hypothetical protein